MDRNPTLSTILVKDNNENYLDFDDNVDLHFAGSTGFWPSFCFVSCQKRRVAVLLAASATWNCFYY